MSLKIGIVMGGYLDENNKLMDKSELNRRIAEIQKQLELKDKQIKVLLEAVVFYEPEMDHGKVARHALEQFNKMGEK